MKKILITGGKGFLALRLLEHYKNKNNILSLGKNDLDIVDIDNVLDTFKNFNPDYVIHTAAVATTDFCNNNPDIAQRINVDGAINVGKACKETGAKMVFLSSEQVFNGNRERGPYSEEHTPIPNTVYGKNKLEAEGLLKNILDELWILRLTWQFDMPQRGLKVNSNIMWSTVSSILKGEKMREPVNEYRGMTYVYEIVENFDKIFDIPYGTYHVGSQNDLNRYEVVKLILQEMGLGHIIDGLLEKDEGKYKDNPRDIRICTDKISKVGIKFSTTEEGIRRCINDYNLKF